MWFKSKKKKEAERLEAIRFESELGIGTKPVVEITKEQYDSIDWSCYEPNWCHPSILDVNYRYINFRINDTMVVVIDQKNSNTPYQWNKYWGKEWSMYNELHSKSDEELLADIFKEDKE